MHGHRRDGGAARVCHLRGRHDIAVSKTVQPLIIGFMSTDGFTEDSLNVKCLRSHDICVPRRESCVSQVPVKQNYHAKPRAPRVSSSHFSFKSTSVLKSLRKPSPGAASKLRDTRRLLRSRDTRRLLRSRDTRRLLRSNELARPLTLFRVLGHTLTNPQPHTLLPPRSCSCLLYTHSLLTFPHLLDECLRGDQGPYPKRYPPCTSFDLLPAAAPPPGAAAPPGADPVASCS